MVELLRQLHHDYRRKVIVVWDRLSVHRSAAAHFQEERPDWFEFEPDCRQAGGCRRTPPN
jgi:hypothetical protein